MEKGSRAPPLEKNYIDLLTFVLYSTCVVLLTNPTRRLVTIRNGMDKPAAIKLVNRDLHSRLGETIDYENWYSYQRMIFIASLLDG